MDFMEDEKSFRELTCEYLIETDPNYIFLASSLASIVRRHCRSQVSFFSTRGWRKEIKPLQLTVMRNLKRNPSEPVLRGIAQEIVMCASTITNGKPYEFVCGVPGGSSAKKENFASLIARYVALELGVKYYAALETVAVGRGSSSHPKQSMHFKARCTEPPITGKFGLLVDDVATSGAHFAECVSQFKKHDTSVICISWIS